MDEKGTRQVREVIKSVSTPAGEQISAVQCADGSLGICRDGAMLDSLQWPAHEREQCLAFLERFARTSGGGSA
jgi:hypothetical protein